MVNGADDASGVFVRKRTLPFTVIAPFCLALNGKLNFLAFRLRRGKSNIDMRGIVGWVEARNPTKEHRLNNL